MGVDLYCGNKKWDEFNFAITYVADQAINRVFKKANLLPNRIHKFKKATEHLTKVILEVVEDRRALHLQQNKCPKDYDLLDIMLTTPIAEKDGKKIYMTNELIRANLTTILSAGHSTTTSMLSWTLNYLHDRTLGNSDYLYKLIHEVDSISGGDRRYQPTIDDVYKNMKFLTKILYETLRITPPIPTIVRHCIKTCNVGGYKINRGDSIMISTLGTHLNPKSWDNPRKYDPERWDKGTDKACGFIAWASGSRQCIGREFAMLTGRIGLFLIINQYSLELAPKANVKPNEHLFVFPKGLYLRARARTNLKPIASISSNENEEKKEKSSSSDKKSKDSDDSAPASDGKRNWSGLMNLIQEKGYRVRVIEGTNSESGSVVTVCQWLVDKALKFNFKSENSAISPDELLKSLKDKKPEKFEIWGFASATYNGKPPNNSKKFYKWIKEKVNSDKDSKYLENIHYFVFGCGNTNWKSTYQKIPNFWDESFKKLGATRIAEPAEFNEAEDDLEDVFSDYYKTMAPALMHSLPDIGDKRLREVNKKHGGDNGSKSDDDDDEDFSKESKLEAQPASSAIETETLGSKKDFKDDEKISFIPSVYLSPDKSFKCKIINIENITENSDRSTLHIKIEINDKNKENLKYEAGDHFIVVPTISKKYAERVLDHFVDYDLNTVVQFNCDENSKCKRFKLPKNKKLTLGNIFCNLVDLKCKPGKQFLINYSTMVKDKDHEKKLNEITGDKESYKDWLNSNEPVSIVDVIDKFPPNEKEFNRLLEMLPILSTRTYSITSSPNVHKNEIHLCLGVVHDKFENGSYKGVCSSFFEDMMNCDNDEDCFVYGAIEKADDTFRVPKDSSKPIILLSAGTGFAPMRGFLHERESQKADGKNIVVFGCRTEKNDILFKDEIKKWKEDDFIDIYYAFSRDDNHDKKYVQDILKEEKDMFWKLIDKEDAVIYICGSGSRMGAGVNDALLEIFKENAPDDADDKDDWANNYLEELEDSSRYLLDVWG